jgi:hypothetical protein
MAYNRCSVNQAWLKSKRRLFQSDASTFAAVLLQGIWALVRALLWVQQHTHFAVHTFVGNWVREALILLWEVLHSQAPLGNPSLIHSTSERPLKIGGGWPIIHKNIQPLLITQFSAIDNTSYIQRIASRRPLWHSRCRSWWVWCHGSRFGWPEREEIAQTLRHVGWALYNVLIHVSQKAKWRRTLSYSMCDPFCSRRMGKCNSMC